MTHSIRPAAAAVLAGLSVLITGAPASAQPDPGPSAATRGGGIPVVGGLFGGSGGISFAGSFFN
ncbi:hypothetical protein GCM10010466_66580 [Planomonospora alba]|uniref:Uncharacterized protein n=1 Tax=Planomonospora alba TaxID=161354 RepID=A0ABP6P3F3_9ACTN